MATYPKHRPEPDATRDHLKYLPMPRYATMEVAAVTPAGTRAPHPARASTAKGAVYVTTMWPTTGRTFEMCRTFVRHANRPP